MRLSAWIPISLLVLQPLLVAGTSPAAAQDPDELTRLVALARLYGIVRFFHPSDEAGGVDWNRFAVLAAERVRSVGSSAGLDEELETLFRPLAPTLRLHPPGEPPRAATLPAGATERTYWQHRGVGLGGSSPYLSARIGRPMAARPGEEFATATQAVPAAAELRGFEIRLRARVRALVEQGEGQGQLWLRVDGPDGPRFFDNMDDRPVTSPEWAAYEIVGEVAEDAEAIFFGGFLHQRGEVWLDAFGVHVRRGEGPWRAIEIDNPGFEASERPDGWFADRPGYELRVVTGGAAEGERALRIRSLAGEPARPLFAGAPARDETVTVELAPGLAATLPLSLEIVDGATWPPADAAAWSLLSERLAATEADDPSRRGAGVAAVIVTWNIFQHFYPYFDVVDADWPGELERALAGALAADSPADREAVLDRLVAAARDGHGRVHHPDLAAGPAGLPLRLRRLGGRVVVTATAVPEGVQRGDEVVTIDGAPVAETLARLDSRTSGTERWKRARTVWQLGRGAAGSTARLALDRDGVSRTVEVARRPPDELPPETDLPPLAELPGGAFYVDLRRSSGAEVTARIDEIAAAPAVIFDLRGYPRGGAEEVLRHLAGEPLQSARWGIPQIVYPDRRRIVGWDGSGRWSLPPARPRIEAPVAFLTDERAISYAESILGIVEHYRLGEIVGGPTAGTNGNVNQTQLPGGFGLRFTGMRVLKHDGSQHHLVGIRPTVAAGPTLAGIRAGRDEVLEAALATLAPE